MTDSTSQQIPAGWYPDPSNSAQQRWWDGTQWSEHTSAPAYAAPVAPPAYGERIQPAYAANPYTGAAEELKAPEGIDLGTAWIWLVAIVPVLPVLGLLFVDWAAMFADLDDPAASMQAQFAMYTNPGYLIATLGGWIGYGVSVLFSYFDYRDLRDRGLPQPFHWAWSFLSYMVYVIGRSVVVKRRSGRSYWGPLWLMIAGGVFSFIVAGWVMVAMFSAMFEAISLYT